MTVDTLLSPCPSCGKARPLGEADEARCDACGKTLPVSREVREAALAHKAALANAPLQLKQAQDIEVLIARGADQQRQFRIALSLLGAPLLVLALFGLDKAQMWRLDHTRPQVLYAPPMIVPLIILLGLALFVGLRIRERNMLVDSLLWAYPIAGMPGSFSCRSCGGPISATTKRAGISCPFCKTENIVGSQISKRAARLALSDYAAKAEKAVARLRLGRRSWLFTLMLASPVVTGLGLGYGAHREIAKLEKKAGELDPTIAYVSRRCPHIISAEIWKASEPLPPTEGCGVVYAEATVTEPFDPHRLLSAQGVDCEWPVKFDYAFGYNGPSKVVELFRDGFGRNLALVDNGFSKRPCLLEGMTVYMDYRELPP